MDAKPSPPVVCGLDAGDLSDRLVEWEDMLGRADRRERVDGAVRIHFPREIDVVALAELVVAEQTCCGWLTFRLTVTVDAVTLEVSGPDEGRAVIESVFGSTG